MGFDKIKEDFIKNTADAISNLAQQINDLDQLVGANNYTLPLIKKISQKESYKDRALELIHQEFLKSSNIPSDSMEIIVEKIKILNNLENISPFIPQETINIDFKEIIQQINKSDDIEAIKKNIE